MHPIAIIVFVFLAAALPIAALRGLATIRREEAKQAASLRNPTHYTGPLYTAHGNEIKGR